MMTRCSDVTNGWTILYTGLRFSWRQFHGCSVHERHNHCAIVYLTRVNICLPAVSAHWRIITHSK